MSTTKSEVGSSGAPKKFKVDVVYCAPTGTIRQVVEVTEGSTIQQALQRARFQEQFRDLNFAQLRVGVFGNLATLATPLHPGDRVEVYRPITCDPETVPRRDRQ
jgi:uncharacterized protein